MTPVEKRAALRAEHFRLEDYRRQLLHEFEALRTAEYSAGAWAAHR
jgi:hypothetical protein